MNVLFMFMNEPMKNTKPANKDKKSDKGTPNTKKSKVATVYFAPLIKNIFIKLYFILPGMYQNCILPLPGPYFKPLFRLRNPRKTLL